MTTLELLGRFWDFVDERQIVRRIMTLGTFAATIQVVWWAMEFSTNSNKVGSDIALIIGSVMIPINAIQGYMFSSYNNSKKEP